MGLNRNNQLVTITLPDLLHSGPSVITTEHPHMRIDIPVLPPEETECTTPPLGRAHTIPAATPPKTPWKPRISLVTEVDDLLTQALADNSSCELEHSATGNVATAEAVMSPFHKPEAPPPPVDTSSQASMEEGEASLKSNPINVSPIAAAYSSHSASPLVDPMELQTDANLAADHMLSVKWSTDPKRQQVIWELGLLLCWNKAEEATSIEKAKVVHSQEVFDTKVDCAKAVLEAKCNYRAAVQEAKTIRGNWLKKSEITYSNTLGKAVAVRSSQSTVLHREHVRLMQELEEQAIREESKSHHDFLSTCQAILHNAPQPLKENLTTSYHVLLGQSPPSPLSAHPARAAPAGEQPPMATSPKPAPKQSPQPKRWHPLPEPWTIQFQEVRDSHLVHLTQTKSCRGLQPRL